MPPDAPALDVSVPRFDYGGAALFEDLAFRAGGGRWTCILGPSGCGKSTLLRLIAGLLDGARVRAADGGPVGPRLAFMAQQDGLLPWLDVAGNVTVGYRLRGETGRDGATLREIALAQLDRVGLADRAASMPAELSGGMRQRVALARTLAEDRPFILMDEPFSALDAITRHRLQDLVSEVCAGRTVVLVTHNPLEALRLGDAVHVLTGFPAMLEDPMELAGSAPRAADDPDVLTHQAELLDRLTRAAAFEERAA